MDRDAVERGGKVRRAVVHVVRDRVHDHRVVQRGGVVMVAGGLVGLRRIHHDSVVIGVVDRRLRVRGIVDRPQRFLQHADPVVDAVNHRLRERVDVRDERVADAQRHEHAVRALGHRLLDLSRRVGRLARAVPVRHVVRWVVVVLVEVPAGDVVGVAVVVLVDPVAERVDQVLPVDEVVVVDVDDARVVRVVLYVEHAVVVDVVVLPVRAARAHARRTGAWDRQLAEVEVHLVLDLGPAPDDAGVGDRDDRVGPAGRDLPRVVRAGALHAEQLLRVVLDQRVVVGIARLRRVVGQLRVVPAVEALRQVAPRRNGMAARERHATPVLDVELRVVVGVAVRREREGGSGGGNDGCDEGGNGQGGQNTRAHACEIRHASLGTFREAGESEVPLVGAFTGRLAAETPGDELPDPLARALPDLRSVHEGGDLEVELAEPPCGLA